MNIGGKLISLGLKQLPQDASIDGFDHSIVFVCNEEVAKIMRDVHKLSQQPNLIILRRGFIMYQGEYYSLKTEKIMYSPVFLSESGKIFCIKNAAQERIRNILGTKENYDISNGSVFTAAKHLKEWESRFLGNRINLNNL